MIVDADTLQEAEEAVDAFYQRHGRGDPNTGPYETHEATDREIDWWDNVGCYPTHTTEDLVSI